MMHPILWWRRRRRMFRIRRAKATLRWVDNILSKSGAPAWKRQQIRRDIITSDQAWLDFLDILEGV